MLIDPPDKGLPVTKLRSYPVLLHGLNQVKVGLNIFSLVKLIEQLQSNGVDEINHHKYILLEIILGNI